MAKSKDMLERYKDNTKDCVEQKNNSKQQLKFARGLFQR